MKKSIMGFILGVILSLTINAFAGNVFEQPAEPTPTPTVIMVTPEPVPTPTPTIVYEVALTDLEAVVKDTKDSCVMIYAYLPDGSALQGSGWVYDDYVITAKHLVEGATKVDIFTDDSPNGVAGGIEYIDLALDVAILRSARTLPSLTLGDSDALKEGEKLVSITSPEGAKNVVEECTFAGKLVTETQDELNISDTVIQGGSSGGAIFNYKSEIIGMAYGGYDRFAGAIPINKIKPILQKLD